MPGNLAQPTAPACRTATPGAAECPGGRIARGARHDGSDDSAGETTRTYVPSQSGSGWPARHTANARDPLLIRCGNSAPTSQRGPMSMTSRTAHRARQPDPARLAAAVPMLPATLAWCRCGGHRSARGPARTRQQGAVPDLRSPLPSGRYQHAEHPNMHQCHICAKGADRAPNGGSWRCDAAVGDDGHRAVAGNRLRQGLGQRALRHRPWVTLKQAALATASARTSPAREPPACSQPARGGSAGM
jgi:hypothetical protein